MKIIYYIVAIIILILTIWGYIATESLPQSWCTSYNIPSLTDSIVHMMFVPAGVLVALLTIIMGYLQSLPSEPIDKKRYCSYCGKEIAELQQREEREQNG